MRMGTDNPMSYGTIQADANGGGIGESPDGAGGHVTLYVRVPEDHVIGVMTADS